MEHFGERRRIQHRLHRVDRCELACFHDKASRLVHESVYRRNKNRRHACPGDNRNRQQPMDIRIFKPIPRIQINAQEDGLKKEREHFHE
ncbi:hypothetical protein D3C78_1688430 [compost metagenome]